MRAEEGGIAVAVKLSSIDSFGKYFLNARHCSRHGRATGDPEDLSSVAMELIFHLGW